MRLLVLAAVTAAWLAHLPSAFADALDAKVTLAKSTHESTQRILAAGQRRKKAAQEDLDKLFKTDAADPSCTGDCLRDFGMYYRTEGSIDVGKLPPRAADFEDAAVKVTAAQPSRLVGMTAAVCGDLPLASNLQCANRLHEIALKLDGLVAVMKAAQQDVDDAKKADDATLAAYTAAMMESALASDEPVPHFADRLDRVRRARCTTAYCWGGHDGRENAIEPILDLPVGMFWAAGGGSLARYMNANNIRIQFTAGLRYWFAYDAMSIGILLAQPNLTESQNGIDFRNSILSPSQVRRPYPTLVVGVWGDILQFSLSYDELRNPPSTNPNHLAEYSANAVLSRALTFGVAISPLTAARNGIGASSDSKQEAQK